MQEKQSKTEALYELLIEHIPVGVFHFNRDGIITVCNEGFEKILNSPKQKIIGLNLLELPDERVVYCIKKVLSGEISHFNGEYRTITSNKTIPLNVKFAPIKENDQITGGLAIVEDFSEQKRAEQLIDHITYHDQLTNLPNRFLFLDRLNTIYLRAKKEKKKFAILFIDLDRFKKINDSLGHEIGDQILLGLADRLSAFLESNETLARFGGDEFIMFLDNLDSSEDAGKKAKQILTCLEEPWVINEHEFHLSASIGISLFPNDGEDIDSLVRHADIATNRAKELGRNNYQFYNPSMNKRSFEKLSMESSIRKAIEQNEFILYFQPQVDFTTKQIMGMEA
ncbi:sensor domain-containing protein [Caldalkalibacillus mannanilyticus]|uniref:sensor domain-containing protein n=1 Tax=Caldalkalibacillus mannanilyticus TaxID=1418 RepID=UPI000687F798|nr:sensor domain-containing diguanylate cyclase [Caldalkalibacillus mannanilyticus]